MKPAFISTLVPPSYWELDSVGRPKNEDAFVNALQFLAEHPTWIQENPEQSSHYFSLIDCTHLSNHTSNAAKKAYAILLMRHPQFFLNPKEVLLTTSHPYREVLISKTQIQTLSSKFCNALDSPIWKKQHRIELMTEQYDPNDVETFLKFITSGELTLTQDNLLPLIYLADYLDIDILKLKCLSFIQNHQWELLQLLDLLQMGLDLGFKEMIWYCLSEVYEVEKSLIELNLKTYSSILQDLLNGIKNLKKRTLFKKSLGEIETYVAPENLSILTPLSQFMPISLDCSPDSMDFTYYIEGILNTCPRIQHLIVHQLNFNIKTDCKLLKKLIYLKSFGNACNFLTSFQDVEDYLTELSPIKPCSLNLTNVKDVTDEFLINLHKKFPELKKLYIKSDQVTSIPFKHLEELDCQGCVKIRELSMEYAEYIDCRGCTSLKKISAPIAKVISIAGCEINEVLAPRSSLSYPRDFWDL